MMLGKGRDIMKRRKYSKSRSRAQSMVEFAATLPIMLLLLAGLMEIANMISIYSQLVDASREGARIAAAGGTDAIVSTTMQTSWSGAVDAGGHLEIWIIRPTLRTNPWRWEGGGSGWGSATETCA